ncbi:hypothetical protein M2387_003877 [Klebsiella sp. BIGb0407]|nr:hypothetical protein [Klebsiella sp. BIGb0407]
MKHLLESTKKSFSCVEEEKENEVKGLLSIS